MRPILLLLSVPVVALLALPLWVLEAGAGILGELAALGPWGAAAGVAVFLAFVALYCAGLQRLQTAVAAPARRRSPRSVWLMFAVPLNFAEDFFIVTDLGASLRADGRVGPRALGAWLVLGHAWCALQIASLVPGAVGVVSGVLALVVWAVHWALTGALRRRLEGRGGVAAEPIAARRRMLSRSSPAPPPGRARAGPRCRRG